GVLDKPPAHVDEVAERLEKRAEFEKQDAVTRRERRKASDRASTGFEKAIAAVREGRRPKLGGMPNIGTISATDPYEAMEVINGKRAREQLKPRTKLTNLRDDPVGRMAAR